MSKPLKTVFKTKHEDKEVELAVVLPSAKIKQQGRHVHAKAYNNAIQAGAMLREELEGHLRNSKLWSDERQAEYDRLRKVLLDGEKKLAKRGLKLSEARDLAIEMSKARLDLQELLAQRNKVDQDTADAIADQEQFNFFVAHCTVYNENGKPFFTLDGVIRRVDEKGRLVDENGRFINEKGEFVDADGVPVDADGRYIVDEEACFLDDDGNPIKEEGDFVPPPPEEEKKTEESSSWRIPADHGSAH
jgi:hypothetical protein